MRALDDRLDNPGTAKTFPQRIRAAALQYCDEIAITLNANDDLCKRRSASGQALGRGLKIASAPTRLPSWCLDEATPPPAQR
jgi:hypothetical protein